MAIQHTTSGQGIGDILERILDKGVVVAGDIKISLADVELLNIKIRLLIASVDKAREMGIDWWEHDPYLSSRAQVANAIEVKPEPFDRLEPQTGARESAFVPRNASQVKQTVEIEEINREIEEKREAEQRREVEQRREAGPRRKAEQRKEAEQKREAGHRIGTGEEKNYGDRPGSSVRINRSFIKPDKPN